MAVEVRTEALREVIQGFAAALAETREFKEYEQADVAVREDRQAQELIEALQVAQQRARWGLLAEAEGEDSLATVRSRTMGHRTVKAYVDAQERLSMLCQNVNVVLSNMIGMDLAAAVAPSCCG